jgi:hypothetical protein
VSTVADIVDLRRLLAEQFPQAHPAFVSQSGPRGVPTGVLALDRLLGGGLSIGDTTELVSDGPGSGSAQVIHALLRQVVVDGRFLALVDGRDSFDVDSEDSDTLSRLLWVRCSRADEALKATDILLRDRNFPLVVLDLRLNPATELRKIPANVWHRFRRLLEHHGSTLLVVTPHQVVSSPASRIRISSALRMDALNQSPETILSQLNFERLRGVETPGFSTASGLG